MASGKSAAPAAKPAEKPAEKAAPAPATPAPAAAAAGGEEEAPKPKAKNPLDLLPPSPMILDAWKRLYSNTKAKDFREVAIKGEWRERDALVWVCGLGFKVPRKVGLRVWIDPSPWNFL